MNNKNFYIMLATTASAGPTVKVIDAPRVKANRGKLIGEIQQPFEIQLVTESGKIRCYL
jgi:hypothetical protein